MVDGSKLASIIWREELCIGNSKIDEQHKAIFENVAELLEVVNSTDQDRTQKCTSMILFIKDYAIQHFADEEEYQRSIDYVDYALHKRIHDEFKRDVSRHEQILIETNFSDKAVREFTGMLVAWILYHVSDADQRITKESKPIEILHNHAYIVRKSICSMWEIYNILDITDIKDVDYDLEPRDDDLVVCAKLSGDISGSVTIVYPTSFVKYLLKSATGIETNTVSELEVSMLLTVSNFIFNSISDLIAADENIYCYSHPATIASKYAIDSGERLVLDTGKGVVGVGITLSRE